MTEQNKNLKNETEKLCALTMTLMNLLILFIIGGAFWLFYQTVDNPNLYSIFNGNFLIR